MLAYSIAELERVVPFKKSFLYDVINTGELPARRFGKKTVVLHDDLMAWMRTQDVVTPKRAEV